MIRRTVFALAILAAPLSAQEGHLDATVVHDALNEEAGPSGNFISTGQIGWYYTPTTSFYLSAILGRFNFAGNESTTPIWLPTARSFNLWTEAANLGGQMLREGSGFSTSGFDWVGSSFLEPIQLIAGVEYLIVLTGRGERALNTALNPHAEFLRTIAHTGSLESPTSSPENNRYEQTAPILRFEGPTVSVPEPGSLLLLATGFVGLAGVSWRRRRTA